jgi:hypothetical protein
VEPRAAGLVRLDDREASRIFALAATAMLDASLGCFEAKYHYQLLRPSQADPLITRAQGTPTAPYGLATTRRIRSGTRACRRPAPR